MNKKWKIFMTVFLLVLSLGGKGLLAYEIYTDNCLCQYFVEDLTGLTLELWIYAIDALLAVIAFAFVETKLKHIVSKLCATAFVTAAYLALVVAVNSFYQSLSWNVMFEWTEPHMHTLDMAVSGIETYFKTGNPKYHIVLLVFGLCVCITFFRRFKKSIASSIKKPLLNRIRKTESNLMRMFAYRIIMRLCGKCLAQNEREEIWAEYVDDWSARERMQAERSSSAQAPRDQNGEVNE